MRFFQFTVHLLLFTALTGCTTVSVTCGDSSTVTIQTDRTVPITATVPLGLK